MRGLEKMHFYSPSFWKSFWSTPGLCLSFMMSGLHLAARRRKVCLNGPSVRTMLSFQSCPTLCDPIDGSPPGSPVPGILQARTVEWVAISFSNAWKWKLKVKSLSCVRLFAIPWPAAYQAPPPMGFSRQEYWSGVPLPSPSTLLKPVPYQKHLNTVETPTNSCLEVRGYCHCWL